MEIRQGQEKRDSIRHRWTWKAAGAVDYVVGKEMEKLLKARCFCRKNNGN
jgi:hypothetical protein